MMNYEVYLIDVLKDQLADYMKTVYEYSEDELDELFLDDEGNQISNRDYLFKHKDIILSEDIINAIYGYVAITNPLEKDNMPKLVAFLASHFYVANYNNRSNQTVLRFLVESDIQVVTQLFRENETFGEALISSFFRNSLEEKRYNSTMEQIKKDNKEDELETLYQIAYPPRMFTLNQKLREVVCNLYNYYINLGCNDVEALELTWGYFFNNIDPLNELDELGFDEMEKEVYKRYTVGLILGDIYEDLGNEPLIQSAHPKDMIAQILSAFFVKIGIIAIPDDPEVRNRMLKYFIMLQDEPQKMKSNREKTHQDDRIMELKKVNPSYILDELTL